MNSSFPYSNIAEVFVADGVGILLLFFLIHTRKRNHEYERYGEHYFSAMLSLTLTACFIEALTFVIDGQSFPLARELSFVMNAYSFFASIFVGYLWCLYTEFRMYHNLPRLQKQKKWLAIPLVVDGALILLNFFFNGLVFSISPENVYARGTMMPLMYVALFFYMLYSIGTVHRAKLRGIAARFYPVFYFVLPCIAGTVVQGLAYGITTGWLGVSIAVLFVYIQLQSMDSYSDALSGLFNRRYMDYLLDAVNDERNTQFYGLMIDINEFKQINDQFGHICGDDVIRSLGIILLESIPNDATAIRYAGDEFVVLLRNGTEDDILSLMTRINERIDAQNREGKRAFQFSISAGYSRFDTEKQTAKEFLQAMDREMYSAKERYYAQAGKDRRKR